MESGPSRSGEATPSVVAGGADGGAAGTVQRQALVPRQSSPTARRGRRGSNAPAEMGLASQSGLDTLAGGEGAREQSGEDGRKGEDVAAVGNEASKDSSGAEGSVAGKNTDADGENAKAPVVADPASTLDVVSWRPLPVYLCMWLARFSLALQQW